MSISIDIANASEAKELTTIALESKQYWGYSSDFIEMCRDELTLKEADFVNSLILVAKNNEKYCSTRWLSTPFHPSKHRVFLLWKYPQ